MNEKAKIFDKILKKRSIDFFHREAFEDQFETVAYRSNLSVGEYRIPFWLVLDNTIFTYLRFRILDIRDIKSREKDVQVKLNDLNEKYKIFKYYIAQETLPNEEENKYITMDVSIPGFDKDFNVDLILRIISEVVEPHFQDELETILETALTKTQLNKLKKELEAAQAAQQAQQA